MEESHGMDRTIEGVSTSNTAFVGYFPRGPMNEPFRITSFDDFKRNFGGLDPSSETSYAIQMYYQNGGGVAFVVRVASGNSSQASIILQGGSPLQNTLVIKAANEGEWGRNLRVAITAHRTDSTKFNLIVREVIKRNGSDRIVAEESFLNLTMTTSSTRYVESLVNATSVLIKIKDQGIGEMPLTSTTNSDGSIPDSAFNSLTGGSNGNAPDAEALEGSPSNKNRDVCVG